jgi:hypothetical protein
MIQDEIIEMAEQAGMTQDGDMWFSFGKGDMDVEHKHLVAFAKLVAAKEREACALICERVYKRMCPEAQENEVGIEAELIRARGEA